LKQTITLRLIAIAGCTKISHVGPKPEIYSGDASLYVLKAGVYLIEAGLADFCYLTLTDYMQPKYAPEAIESLEFYRGIDNEIGRLLSLGCIVAATAAHHDFAQLAGQLRSHGGRYEEMVPMVLSHELNDVYYKKSQCDPRTFDIFDFACNGVTLIS